MLFKKIKVIEGKLLVRHSSSIRTSVHELQSLFWFVRNREESGIKVFPFLRRKHNHIQLCLEGIHSLCLFRFTTLSCSRFRNCELTTVRSKVHFVSSSVINAVETVATKYEGVGFDVESPVAISPVEESVVHGLASSCVEGDLILQIMDVLLLIWILTVVDVFEVHYLLSVNCERNGSHLSEIGHGFDWVSVVHEEGFRLSNQTQQTGHVLPFLRRTVRGRLVELQHVLDALQSQFKLVSVLVTDEFLAEPFHPGLDITPNQVVVVSLRREEQTEQSANSVINCST